MKIESKDLVTILQKWQSDSSAYTGLKEPALLQKVIDEVEHMATNEEIKQRIKRADAAEGHATATDLIEIAKAEFCNGFCSKQDECDKSDWTIKCPINIL
ncbi:MAG: hypothetical protein Q4C46_05610 [Bacillota bacterium]|nr:hypothetical protein [Bacillota bacterium]